MIRKIKGIMIASLFFMAFSLNAQFPALDFEIDENTAVVITDPQVDFLSPDGATWKLVGEGKRK